MFPRQIVRCIVIGETRSLDDRWGASPNFKGFSPPADAASTTVIYHDVLNVDCHREWIPCKIEVAARSELNITNRNLANKLDSQVFGHIDDNALPWRN